MVTGPHDPDARHEADSALELYNALVTTPAAPAALIGALSDPSDFLSYRNYTPWATTLLYPSRSRLNYALDILPVPPCINIERPCIQRPSLSCRPPGATTCACCKFTDKPLSADILLLQLGWLWHNYLGDGRKWQWPVECVWDSNIGTRPDSGGDGDIEHMSAPASFGAASSSNLTGDSSGHHTLHITSGGVPLHPGAASSTAHHLKSMCKWDRAISTCPIRIGIDHTAVGALCIPCGSILG